MSIEQVILAVTGCGYLVVGVLQALKGNYPGGIIWCGYAFAQVGLWLQLK
jgi:hypothetical protein